jgi:hypothetical protein
LATRFKPSSLAEINAKAGTHRACTPQRPAMFYRCGNGGPLIKRVRLQTIQQPTISCTTHGNFRVTNGDASMANDDRRSSAKRRSDKDRRSGADTRSDEERRLSGERRSNNERRSGSDRRSDLPTTGRKGKQ